MATPVLHDRAILEREDFPSLFAALQARGFEVVGPTVRDQAIVYGPLRAVEDLPIGWTDEQEAGTYRLRRRDDAALFGYVVGPHSWKRFLFPADQRVFRARRQEGAIEFVPEPLPEVRYAFLGVRACELQAMLIQDRVFTGGPHVDPHYQQRRQQALVIAVQCGQAGRTCFCASMKTGPRAEHGYDLALTEVIEPGRHYFVVETGSEAGAAIAAPLPMRRAEAAEVTAAAERSARAEAQMGRVLEVEGLRELLAAEAEHPQWQTVADRCLTCANCTMVCPTCFCTTVEDVTDLTGHEAERWRRWDSCFTLSFSYLVGGSVRASTRSRYRQWLTHKLGTWWDQFGTSGCVGCGRCITWCPVGIDLTEEVRALRRAPSAPASAVATGASP